MSNTDDILYEQCKFIAEELDRLRDNDFWTEETEDEESRFYFEGNYGEDYIWRSGIGLMGVRILVAFGGPNIYVDTFTGYVHGYWGGEQKYPLSLETSNAITDCYREYVIDNIYSDYMAGIR